MTGPTWKLEDDLETVTITFPTNPVAALQLKTDDLEKMLKSLGEFRARMKPEVLPDYTLGQKVQVIPDPAWRTEPEAMEGHTLLHIRDPRFGWLHYLIPRPEAERLSNFIQNQLASAPLSKPKEVN